MRKRVTDKDIPLRMVFAKDDELVQVATIEERVEYHEEGGGGDCDDGE